MTPHEQWRDAQISHMVGLRRLSSSVVKRIIRLLDATDEDLSAQIARRLASIDGPFPLSRRETERLERLAARLRDIRGQAFDAVSSELRQEMLDLASYEVEFQQGLAASVLDIDVVAPSVSQLRAAVVSRPFQGRLLREWASGLEQADRRRIRDEINIGLTEGESIQQIARRVRGRRSNRYRDGVIHITRRNAEAVVRTAVSHTQNVARQELYQANADIVQSVQWTATLDSRTSAVCRGRDGRIYPLDKAPAIPAHINCRSVLVPYFGPRAGERASEFGPVPDATTYGDWLRRRGAQEQDEILGVDKGRLFRRGKLTLNKFIDRAGNELTLDQLRTREAQAFERAGL
ncbi:MAG: minor capsid protein [Pseudomonadota bacterium]